MKKEKNIPEQHQDSQPGNEEKMHPKPEYIRKNYKGSGKLKGKVALITGGDSGIGRSVAVHFAKEGANVAIVYLDEDKDAQITKDLIEKENSECLLLKFDITEKKKCKHIIDATVDHFGGLNIVVNNAAMQFPQDKVEDISEGQLEKTFKTNIYSMFYLVQEAIPHLKENDVIINTGSVTAYLGNKLLLDYSSTKGAIISFTRTLSQILIEKGIRVNAVAPGPIWTPLIPSSFDSVEDFGKDTPMKRPGQPSELGPAYVFLASEDSSYMTGQVLHINGGKLVGG
ncbi:SDR family oxidoreductase [Mesonia maritima]|uniref:NAD(P)-dependent dehydrogenase (Short-subunit alcohol dehydrogenase family) n=1 Tax=Mesonia maritima TaxID=1793873 RepID=A0ABU1K830_9FLAO|nr:SDR family oxidoreductase [Mesonia maritima]MDR6301769.1 NAD(P)-dependent dehydrogenase (short-subunit alcohol dehydrogenase family) [Mesonia maritima]